MIATNYNETDLYKLFDLRDTSYWGIAYPLDQNHSLIGYKVFYKNKLFICNCKTISKLQKLIKFYKHYGKLL